MKSCESTFRTWDNTDLFYRAWLPARRPRKALLLFHRGHEHSGRWQETVEQLGLEDVAIFAWDARGHGLSPGERGSAENLSAVAKDVDAFVRHICAKYQIALEDMIVLAHSVGAVAVTAWVHDFAPRIRAMILATPAFRVKLYVPLAVPMLRLKQKVFGHSFVKSYVKARMLTHDPEQAAQYEADPLIFRQIAVNMLLDLYDTSTRLLADAAAIRVPTLMLAAESDWVVKLPAQRQFFQRLSSPVKQMEVYPGLFHALFHEQKRSEIVRRIREFCLERFDQPMSHDSLIDSDQNGHTKQEYDRLRSPGGIGFRVIKLVTKIGGFFSHGIKLGWKSGFDSGATLDYVYENKPRGATWLGRQIDRGYLESVGWRGIRQRKRYLEQLLRQAILQTHRERQPVRILDIAAGHGRYLLEVMRSLPQIPMTALLRDYQRENVEAATRLAGEFGLHNMNARQGDAFDRSSLASLSPRPTIGIVSGLYELFPENHRVLDSLRGLADSMTPGGYLIYTNQPWHPQIEFIARVLINREGQPWIMRRRTQAEMDELVQAAGFEKMSMEIDQWGIFTVSLARRKAGPEPKPRETSGARDSFPPYASRDASSTCCAEVINSNAS